MCGINTWKGRIRNQFHLLIFSKKKEDTIDDSQLDSQLMLANDSQFY